MPDSNSSLKLYAVLLGGMAEGCNIELHDVQFTVSDKIENAYFDLLDKWFGIKEKMHVDSYIILDIIDGYEVSLRSEKSSQKEKLFFINLGAYQEGKFSELHEIKFVVDSSKISVKKRAKASMLQGKTSVHTDDLFEVDDCITISEINGWYIHLTPTHKEEKLTPVNGYMPLPKKTVREYLIRNQTQLFDTN